METNLTEGQSSDAVSPLAEPHFDEEATVLARPVVPLEKVAPIPNVHKAAAHPDVRRAWVRKRAWVFGLTLIGALLFGMSATAFYYSRINRNTAKPPTYTETISSGSSGVPSRAPAVKAEPPVRVQNPIPSDTVEKSGTEVATTIQPAKTAPQIATKPVARRVAVITFGRPPREDEQSREERREARREAKEQKRERRRVEDSKTSNELLRIREIFEGPRKP